MMSWSHPAGRFTLLGDACHATLPYLAQGAAQAVEDAAVLGHLFEKIQHKHQLPDLLAIYEAVRKPRTTRVVQGSSHLGAKIFHLHDGPRQRERDRQLREFQDAPFEGYQNRWRDPTFQKFLFDYDARQVVEDAWKVYEEGKFPGTAGRFAADDDDANRASAEEGRSELDELRRTQSRASGPASAASERQARL